MKKILTSLAFVLVVFAVYRYASTENKIDASSQNDSIDLVAPVSAGEREALDGQETAVSHTGLGIHSVFDGYPTGAPAEDQVVVHTGYSLAYNETHEQPDWVCYILTKAEIKSTTKTKRTDNFRPDEAVSSFSATPQDYSKSGYDRGHLAPAADMSWSEQTMSESFFMSNMSPQSPAFNRGIWKELEEKVRDWAVANDSLFVVTGPVFLDNKGQIGKEKVTIPGHYYKVILDMSGPTYKAIAFYLPNEGSDKPIYSFAITVDALEKITGINFFGKLPAATLEPLESTMDVKLWP